MLLFSFSITVLRFFAVHTLTHGIRVLIERRVALSIDQSKNRLTRGNITANKIERCVVCVCCYSCRYAFWNACARISIRLALFGCVEINRVRSHIAFPSYSSSSSSRSSPGFLFVFIRRICGESNQSIHGIYHYSVCDPSLNHRKAYGLDVFETYLPGSHYSYFWYSFVDIGDNI